MLFSLIFTVSLQAGKELERVRVCVGVYEGEKVCGMMRTDGTSYSTYRRQRHTLMHTQDGSMSIRTNCYCLALAGDQSYWSVFVRASVCLYWMCLCKASLSFSCSHHVIFLFWTITGFSLFPQHLFHFVSLHSHYLLITSNPDKCCHTWCFCLCAFFPFCH